MKRIATTLASLTLFSAAHADVDLKTPAIDGVVAAGTKIEFIRDGFEGTEGPLGLPDGSLVFTETQANRITRIAPDGSISTFLENSNGSNGLARLKNGDIVSVQTGKPSIGIVYPADRAATLVDGFAGKPLNRPNDLVADTKGGIYFTDPGARPAAGQPPVPTAVYYRSPAGKLSQIDTSIARPNGIQLSPDEKTLYVANTAGEYIFAYDVAADGTASKRRNFAKLAGFKQTENGWSSGADGLAVDAQGRLYVASSEGIQIFSSKGAALGVIPLPKAPQNLAFAGKDRKTLYVVGRGAAYRIALLAEGPKTRAK
ncbi:MAG TPA: SMP-30/gluconolactonase/LRE family protein [Povalibacter sp.]|uniref:SMP-30/gluconolactonase/LRE family protein n=1 Tax=Povalibacter sp. TaxID=1962978 RepID=UPI002C3AF1FA|nr:SMP-30/gluconolactonase/LRE family protein [Povalibacter sp.]HMN46113.1 SMP-30/gluconolactonase/LRE family protein [Povalibacter sp.]